MTHTSDPIRQRYANIRNRIAPGLRFNQLVYEDVLTEVIPDGGVWLDAGCGWQVLQGDRLAVERAMVGRPNMVIGCDPDAAAIKKHRSIQHRVVCVLDALPFKAGTLNLITANMVMEHVDTPKPIFAEVARTLKPKGRFLTHTPFKWSYFSIMARSVPHWLTQLIRPDRRAAEDYYPVRYQCNTPSAQRNLAQQAGLTVERLSMLASDAVTECLAGRWWGRLLNVLELTWIRLSLTQHGKYLRVTLCTVFSAKPH